MPTCVIPRYGGKQYHLGWLLPLLPEATTYVEPFFGGGSVFFNRRPARVEVVNDLDGDIVNFFRVLRDPEMNAELVEQLELTPYSRLEHEISGRLLLDAQISPVERARCFYVQTMQSHAKIPGNSWSYSIADPSSLPSSNFRNKYLRFAGIIERLRLVQIECLDALDVLKRYDSPETLFYCDPPYFARNNFGRKYYEKEMKDEKSHESFLKTCLGLSGNVAISGYDSQLYNDMLSSWNKYTTSVILRTKTEKQRRQEECLWTNYESRPIGDDLFSGVE